MKKEVIKNILYTKIYLSIIIVMLTILIILPIIFQTLIIPSFKKQIVNNIVNESKRDTLHLLRSIDYLNLSTNEIDLLLENELKEFDVEQVQYLLNNGKIIYSTLNKNIGTNTNYTYFYKISNQWKFNYHVKYKWDKLSDKKYIGKDIIQIYIPIIENNKVYSIFEVYYNMSKEMSAFRKLSNFIMEINILVSFFAAFFLYITVYFSSKKNLEIKEYQQKLRTLADFDSLTNLYNRRYFFKKAKHLVEISKINKIPISIAMIDIDNFKKINDTYGHQVGDFIIKNLASEIKKITRKNDIIARYGGEEFIALFPNTDINNVEIITNKICKHIENLKLRPNNININFTISIGINQCKFDDTLDEFVHKADMALYHAKSSGKNRVLKNICA